MSSRITPAFARTALIALLCLGVAVAQATAQQADQVQQAEPVPAPVQAPVTVTTSQPQENGPRVRPEMPRTQANFRVSTSASKYQSDHRTTIRISTILLIVAVVVLVVVLLL